MFESVRHGPHDLMSFVGKLKGHLGLLSPVERRRVVVSSVYGCLSTSKGEEFVNFAAVSPEVPEVRTQCFLRVVFHFSDLTFVCACVLKVCQRKRKTD